MKLVKIEGNTYPVRDHLKALGGIWKPKEQAWYVPEDKLAEAKAFVEAAPARAPKEPRQRKPIHARCPTCGTEFEV